MINFIQALFLPADLNSIDEKRKAVLLVRFFVVLALFSLTYLFLCYFTGIMIGVYTNLIMFPLILTGLLVFRKTKNFILSSNIAVSGLVAGIAEGVLFSGNIQSPALLWLITGPSCAFLLGNKKAGIQWTLIVIMVMLVFGFISIVEIPVPYLFPKYLQNYLLTFTFIAVTAFFAIVISIYDSTNIAATKALALEKERSEKLLLNILPAEVADELKQTGEAEAKQYNNVTVLFTDFVNFTGISEQMTPTELVKEIHHNFKMFDSIIETNGLEKIKTIGDAYLAVCGLPKESETHAQRVTKAAIEIRDYMVAHGGKFQIRIGIHSGPVVAGIVGVKKYAYDIWGDTVNTAARMEQNSEAGKINISGATYELIKNEFECEHRGKIQAKNKGEVDMYFVNKTRQTSQSLTLS